MTYKLDTIRLLIAHDSQDEAEQLMNALRNAGRATRAELVLGEDELLRALDAGAQVLGINNRNLRPFQVDLATTLSLRPLVPPDRILVSESGIFTREHVLRLQEAGVDAVLVGECNDRPGKPAVVEGAGDRRGDEGEREAWLRGRLGRNWHRGHLSSAGPGVAGEAWTGPAFFSPRLRRQALSVPRTAAWPSRRSSSRSPTNIRRTTSTWSSGSRSSVKRGSAPSGR